MIYCLMAFWFKSTVFEVDCTKTTVYNTNAFKTVWGSKYVAYWYRTGMSGFKMAVFKVWQL